MNRVLYIEVAENGYVVRSGSCKIEKVFVFDRINNVVKHVKEVLEKDVVRATSCEAK